MRVGHRYPRYHRAQHGTNWLTQRYFQMMREASDNPRVNFQLHCIELSRAADLVRLSTRESWAVRRGMEGVQIVFRV